MQPDSALSEFGAAQNLGRQIVGDDDALARAHLAAGVNQRFPGKSVGGDRLGQKDFDFSRGMLAMTVEAGWQDAGIVEDQAVLGCEERREIAEGAIFPLAGGAVDHEHPRPGAVGEGFLGDEIVGEVVIELGKKHLLTIVNWKPDAKGAHNAEHRVARCVHNGVVWSALGRYRLNS